MAVDTANLVTVGSISGVFGVKGWLKIYSFTSPRENIVGYSPWWIKLGGQWQQRKVISGKRHGKGVVARIEDCDTRDDAFALIESEIAIERSQLPKPAEGEYYWADLIGLEVRNLDNVELGRVSSLFETGANDVLVVKGDRERLIPFIQPDFVCEVDLAAGRMTVDWDPEF